MNTQTQTLISEAVKKVTGAYSPNRENYIFGERYSIIPCAHNDYLDPEFDPFRIFEMELLVHRVRETHGYADGGED